ILHPSTENLSLVPGGKPFIMMNSSRSQSRFNRRGLSTALIAACAAAGPIASQAMAGDYVVTKSADTVVDSRGLTLDSSVAAYGIGINGNSFEDAAITTFDGWQYSAYWVK